MHFGTKGLTPEEKLDKFRLTEHKPHIQKDEVKSEKPLLMC